MHNSRTGIIEGDEYKNSQVWAIDLSLLLSCDSGETTDLCTNWNSELTLLEFYQMLKMHLFS